MILDMTERFSAIFYYLIVLNFIHILLNIIVHIIVILRQCSAKPTFVKVVFPSVLHLFHSWTKKFSSNTSVELARVQCFFLVHYLSWEKASSIEEIRGIGRQISKQNAVLCMNMC